MTLLNDGTLVVHTTDYEKVKRVLVQNAYTGTMFIEPIRCKDCKHYKTAFCAIDTWTEDVKIFKVREMDYCSYAEPKEE